MWQKTRLPRGIGLKKDYPRRALSSDNYYTDEWLLSVFDDWFDPCPYDPEWMTDGLLIDWPHKTFVNPPYSNPLPWAEKAVTENKRGKTIVLLLKHDTSTKWYQHLHENGARFLPIIGRLKFQTSRAAAFPSVLVILGIHPESK